MLEMLLYRKSMPTSTNLVLFGYFELQNRHADKSHDRNAYTRRREICQMYLYLSKKNKSPLSGELGLVDRVLALHAMSRGFDSHRGHKSEQFFRSNRPGYPHPVSSELENSGIRVAVGDCSVTERRRWRPPYQTGKTVHVHAKHYKHNEDGCTAPSVCGNDSVPLSHSGNVVTRIGIHTHTHINHHYMPLTLKV